MKACITILVTGLALTVAASESPSRGEQGNLALVAKVSTSYVSGHETLTAVQDGTAPRSSGDTSHGAYGNWPKRGVQWIQYSWTRPVNINGVSVYWYDDNRGVRVPKAARILRWDGRSWIEIKGRDGGLLPLKKDAFNTLAFEPFTTDKLRLELTGKGESSTGVIEWAVSDAGGSPMFPPIVVGPPDRIVRPRVKTDLSASVRAVNGKDLTTGWSRVSGPADVQFADPHARGTDATFTAPGDYMVRITARQGSEAAFADVHITVRDFETADWAKRGPHASLPADQSILESADQGADRQLDPALHRRDRSAQAQRGGNSEPRRGGKEKCRPPRPAARWLSVLERLGAQHARGDVRRSRPRSGGRCGDRAGSSVHPQEVG